MHRSEPDCRHPALTGTGLSGLPRRISVLEYKTGELRALLTQNGTHRVVLSISVAAGVAGATHSDGEDPSYDFVWGTGQFVFGPPRFPEPIESQVHVNAKSGPLGEDPQGHITVHSSSALPGFEFDSHGEVTCLRVVENRASVGYRVTQHTNPDRIGTFAGLYINDNGEPAGQDIFSAAPPNCPPPVAFIGPIEGQGNFVVHQATP